MDQSQHARVCIKEVQYVKQGFMSRYIQAKRPDLVMSSKFIVYFSDFLFHLLT